MKSKEIAALPIAERKQMAARERLRGLGEVDIVKAWYEADEPFDLKPSEDQIRQRWDFAKAQFLKRKRYQSILEALMEEFKISISQARNDVRNMKYLFGDFEEIPKLAHKQRAIEMSLAAFDVAKKAGDADGMAKATKVYISAAGLDRDDAEPFDLDKLMKERMYVEVMDPLLRNLLLNLLEQSGGVLDTSMMFERVRAAKESEDYIDHEEIPAT